MYTFFFLLWKVLNKTQTSDDSFRTSYAYLWDPTAVGLARCSIYLPSPPCCSKFQDKSQTSCLFTPTYFRRHVYRDVDIYFIPGYPFHTWWNFHKLLSTIVWSMETSPIATFFSVDLSEPEWKPNPISMWYSVCRSRQSRTLPSLCSFKCSIFRLILSCSQTCSLSLYFLQTGL